MSSDTKEKILEAANELVVRQRNPEASMGKIAAEAGVSRQAVYLHFDSRTDLLLALVAWVDERLDIYNRFAPVRAIEDPVEQLLAFVQTMMQLEEELFETTLVFESARLTDDALDTAFRDRMEARRTSIRRRWNDVDEAGNLRKGWTVERATEATWGLTTPSAYRTFVHEAGWDLEEWIDFVLDIVRDTLLDDA